MIELRELAEKALQLWTLPVIEAALGGDAKLVIPPALRTRKLVLRLRPTRSQRCAFSRGMVPKASRSL